MYRVQAAALSVGTKGEAATVWLLERCQSESREAEDLLGRGPGGAYFKGPLLNELFENDGLIAIHDEPQLIYEESVYTVPNTR